MGTGIHLEGGGRRLLGDQFPGGDFSLEKRGRAGSKPSTYTELDDENPLSFFGTAGIIGGFWSNLTALFSALFVVIGVETKKKIPS